jgi:hypothetical protein
VALACVRNDASDPCAGVACSGHGTCRTDGDGITCDCASGYRHLSGECGGVECDLECVPEGARDAPAEDDGDRAEGDVPADETGTDDAGADADGGDDASVDDDGAAEGDAEGEGDAPSEEPGAGDADDAADVRDGAVDAPVLETCLNGIDDDGDGETDCEDAECEGERCREDPDLCTHWRYCRVCRGGSCVTNSPAFDDSCTPSCGALGTYCDAAPVCCPAGALCPDGDLGPAYDCAECCNARCGCIATETPERTCLDGADNDCDGATDCADPDCDGLRCRDDGTICGRPVDCRVCADGGCAWNSVDFDADCRPSCGSLGGWCGVAAACCAAGDVCGAGEIGASYDCERCCRDTCDCVRTEPREVSCSDGVDNDCDTAIDCRDDRCLGMPCGAGEGICLRPDCCAPNPCGDCECGTFPDACGATVECGRCLAPPLVCDGCSCVFV